MAYNHHRLLSTGGLVGLFLVMIVLIQEQCQAKLRTTSALLEFGPTSTRRFLSRPRREISPERVLDGTAVQQIVQMNDVIWTTKITLGGQQFTVVVDTGSSDLWLPSIACTSPECLRRRRYDPAKSSSYSRQARDRDRTIQIHYGGNVQVYGREARDTLELGGLKIESQSFLLVHQITGQGMYDLKVDGILGLGYMSLSRIGAPTPFELMLDQNLIQNPVFSIAPRGDRGEGLLTFGAPGQGYRASEFKNVSLIEAKHWQFELKGVSLESNAEETNSVQANDVQLLEVCTGHTRCKAIADSGAALIIGSSREVRAINEKLGASELANGIFKFANCEMINSLPNLVFTLNHHDDKLVLTPEMYTVKRRGHCVSGLALAPYGGFPFWILGTTFLDNFNTLYDYKNERVGFAPLH